MDPGPWTTTPPNCLKDLFCSSNEAVATGVMAVSMHMQWHLWNLWTNWVATDFPSIGPYLPHPYQITMLVAYTHDVQSR